MAKKTVATLHTGKMDGRSYTKVIKMVKSPKTGAYILMSKWFRTKREGFLQELIRILIRFKIVPSTNCGGDFL